MIHLQTKQTLCLHPKLGKKIPCHKTSDNPDQDEPEAYPAGFDVAIAEETEKRIGDKNDPSNRCEQNQCEKVVRVSVCHEAHIKQRGGNQGATYKSTPGCKTSESLAHAFNLWSWSMGPNGRAQRPRRSSDRSVRGSDCSEWLAIV